MKSCRLRLVIQYEMTAPTGYRTVETRSSLPQSYVAKPAFFGSVAARLKPRPTQNQFHETQTRPRLLACFTGSSRGISCVVNFFTELQHPSLRSSGQVDLCPFANGEVSWRSTGVRCYCHSS